MQPANLGRYIIQSYPLDKVSAMILLLPGTYIEHSHNVSKLHMFLPSVAIHNNTIHITMLYNSPSQSALELSIDMTLKAGCCILLISNQTM